MNEYYTSREYYIGDLITIAETSYMGMVVGKKHDVTSDFYGYPETHLYKIHFCGDNEADERWMLEDALQKI
tara:strand:+ start:825 stop:1037 length:213 start_codon:yes stop_codon:yes gene_type:complete